MVFTSSSRVGYRTRITHQKGQPHASQDTLGGGLFDSIKNFFRRGKKFVSDNSGKIIDGVRLATSILHKIAENGAATGQNVSDTLNTIASVADRAGLGQISQMAKDLGRNVTPFASKVVNGSKSVKKVLEGDAAKKIIGVLDDMKTPPPLPPRPRPKVSVNTRPPPPPPRRREEKTVDNVVDVIDPVKRALEKEQEESDKTVVAEGSGVKRRTNKAQSEKKRLNELMQRFKNRTIL